MGGRFELIQHFVILWALLWEYVFFLAGGGRFQYTKFGTALFEVGGGRFLIIHDSHVCAMFHIQGSRQTENQTRV